MYYVRNDRLVYFDCDDTLVMWDHPDRDRALYFPDPNYVTSMYSQGDPGYHLVPHRKHISKLKGYHRSGWFVVVWSAAGPEWAKSVVDTLNLRDFVSLVIGKPTVCYDDLPTGEGIGPRRYLMDRTAK